MRQEGWILTPVSAEASHKIETECELQPKCGDREISAQLEAAGGDADSESISPYFTIKIDVKPRGTNKPT